MKKLFTLVAILISVLAYSQTATTTSFQLTERNNVGITSPKQDTLYLIDEPIGYTIKNTWSLKDSTGHEKYPVKPYFVFLSKDKFTRKLNQQILIEARRKK